MRHMKRALSLVLAMVMLLGMVMIPTGAAGNFADAALIENTEAVAITSGIGLFAGTSDGNFAPKATVTRAQMATIIVKMLRGNDFNADSFKGVGVNPFPDTAAFEGGWAEGYINACYQMGVVAGYGDGTFKPGRELTTAEALTMIINALGIDPGTGDWPTNYMAKAEELKFYGDLANKPNSDEPLNRDQLAVIVWEGMQYSPAGKTGWQVKGNEMLFESYADALKMAGGNASLVNEAVGDDSLANKVYEIKPATGWITGNAATGEKYTVLSDKDGVVGNYYVQTGVDMLGHYVTVYYKDEYTSDKQPGQVYTIVDESTVVTVSGEAIATAKDYKAAFGSNCALSGTSGSGVMHFDGTYDCDTNNDGTPEFGTIAGYAAGSAAPMGTYIMVDGVIVTYLAPVDVYATYVVDINPAVGYETVTLNNVNHDGPIPNSEDDDRIVEYDGMQIGDYVTYVAVMDSQNNPIYVISPVEKITGTIAKTRPAQLGSGDYDTITIGDTTYPAFEAEGTSPSKNMTKLETALSAVDYDQTYTLYINEDGSYIGFESVGTDLVLDNTVFLLGCVTPESKDKYNQTFLYNKGRGIDMDGEEVVITLGKAADVDTDGIYTEGVDTLVAGDMSTKPQGFYSVSDSTDTEDKKEGIQVLTAYAGAYSPEKPTYALQPMDTTSTFANGWTLATAEAIPAVIQANMGFFILSGELTDDEPLSVTKERPSNFGDHTDPTKFAVTANPSQVYMLVTRTPGSYQSKIETFVWLNNIETTTDFYFFATAKQLAEGGMVPDGETYTVYDVTTGEETEIIVKPGVSLLTGMQLGQKDSDGIITGVSAVSSTIKADDGAPQVVANLGLLGTSSGGRLRAWNQNFDMNTEKQNNGNSASVVDLRTEEELEVDTEITSLNQLLTMQANDPGLVVVMDLYMTDNSSGSGYVIETIFVHKVIRRTVGMDAVIYVDNIDGNGTVTGYAARSSAYGMGDPVTVRSEQYDKLTNKGDGFYIYTVDKDGEIVLEPFYTTKVYVGTSGTVAMHEKIDGIVKEGESTLLLTTVDQHANCAFGCVKTSEPLKTFYVTSNTRILDATSGTITNQKGMSVADFYQLYQVSDLQIDDYCDTGARSGAVDNSAELVVITNKSEFTLTCDGEHTGWSAVTGNSITAPGNYYLTDDMTSALTISASGVKLCMCGHSIQIPKTTTGSALNVTGSVELVTCNPRNISKLVGVEAPAVNGSCTINTAVDGSRITMTGLYRCSEHGWHDDGTWKPFTAGSSVTGGKYYLAGNTTATGQIKVSGNVTLCLGSSTLSAPATDVSNFIVVDGSSTALTIYGDTNGKIQGSSATGTRGIQVKGKATLTLKSGTITGFTNNSSSYGGAGICVDAYSTFIMDGGTITGNKVTSANSAALGGAGVTVPNGGKFTMNGGTITGNEVKLTHGSAKGGGGAVSASGGTFTMVGGTIEENTAYVENGNWGGGGVHVADTVVSSTTYQGSFIMNGGTIQNNTATTNKSAGGGVSVTNGGVFTMDGGTITGNHAKQGGGMQGNGATVTITINGGTISSNKAYNTGNGGGGIAMMSGAPLVINGGEITGNEAYNGAKLEKCGAIFMSSTSSLTIHGGNIHGNPSSSAGGVRVSAGGGTIDETKATTIIMDEIEFVGSPTISGGTFTTDPTMYVPSTGYTVTQNADSTYTVTKNP